MTIDREQLGQWARAAWSAWCKEQPVRKPCWLASWDECPEWEREVSRRIGEFVVLKYAEEQRRGQCGHFLIWHAIEREYFRQAELRKEVQVNPKQSLPAWAELIAVEASRAAVESHSPYAFIQRMIRLAAYGMIGVEAAQAKATDMAKATLDSSPALSSACEVID